MKLPLLTKSIHDYFLHFLAPLAIIVSQRQLLVTSSKPCNKPFSCFKCVLFLILQDDEHIGDVYQDEAKQAALLLYRDKTDDALLMVRP